MEIFENSDKWLDEFNNSWLKHVRKTGEVDWSKYKHPKNIQSPTGRGVDPSQSRLLLVSSSGAYLKNRHSSFDTEALEGDYSFRILQSDSPAQNIDYAHGHYDDTFIKQDMQVGIPFGHLNDFVAEGKLGSLIPSAVSFMGYQPDSAHVATQLASRILTFAKEQGATAALFAPL